MNRTAKSCAFPASWPSLLKNPSRMVPSTSFGNAVLDSKPAGVGWRGLVNATGIWSAEGTKLIGCGHPHQQAAAVWLNPSKQPEIITPWIELPNFISPAPRIRYISIHRCRTFDALDLIIRGDEGRAYPECHRKFGSYIRETPNPSYQCFCSGTESRLVGTENDWWHCWPNGEWWFMDETVSKPCVLYWRKINGFSFRPLGRCWPKHFIRLASWMWAVKIF